MSNMEILLMMVVFLLIGLLFSFASAFEKFSLQVIKLNNRIEKLLHKFGLEKDEK